VAGFPSEIGEHRLRYVLREVRVAGHLPQRCGVNQVDVPCHQFAEGTFRTFFCVAAQQLKVVVHFCSPYSTRESENRTGNLSFRWRPPARRQRGWEQVEWAPVSPTAQETRWCPPGSERAALPDSGLVAPGPPDGPPPVPAVARRRSP